VLSDAFAGLQKLMLPDRWQAEALAGLRDGKVMDQEVIFKELGRIRHVVPGPDGALYALLPERIARIAPAATVAAP